MSGMQKVIYLVGAGNSGSTVISMVLGAHPHMVSVGELSHLPKYVRSAGEVCSCGAIFRECPFWSKVDARTADILPAHGYGEVLTRNWRNPALSVSDRALIAANEFLYRSVSAAAGVSVVVDASKDMRRLCYLAQSEQVEVVPVYVVRDVRAYMDSFLRRKQGSALKGFLRWCKMNLQAVLGLVAAGLWRKTVRVSFASFTREPESALRRVCAAAGIPYDPAMLAYHTQAFHNIDGTKSRFELRPIVPMEGWKNRLPQSARIIYWLCGGWLLNRMFGAGS